MRLQWRWCARAGIGVLLLGAAQTSCVRFAPSSSDGRQPANVDANVDWGAADHVAAADATAETSNQDGPNDASPGDRRADEGIVDAAPHDVPPRDVPTAVDTSGVDKAVVVDMGSDTASVDTGSDTASVVDAPSATGCGSTATLTLALTPKMVVCEGAVQLDQCSSGALCDTTGGWALCPATVYQGAFSTTPPPGALPEAWIAGCVRDGGAPTAPVDGSCSCILAVSGMTTVAWTCAAQAVSSFNVASHLGLVTSQTCNLVGIQNTATAGYWVPLSATMTRRHAICCHP